MDTSTNTELPDRAASPGDPFHGWHLDKRVPIGLILVLLMQGVGAIWVIADIKKDVEVLKSYQVTQHERDQMQDMTTTSGQALIRSDISALSLKLDRYLERSRP